MPAEPPVPRPAWPLNLAIVVLAAAGLALTVCIFYPGVMTYDARYVYADMRAGKYGDWQSPLMIVLWRLVDPLAPGPASLFLLIATTYWTSFAVLALALARRGGWLALIVPILALAPPAFCFAGILWRDVLFAGAWLLAAALVLAVDRAGPRRWATQCLALVLVGAGVLLRPNALIAAPLLLAYVFWPTRFDWRKTAAIYVPAALACYGLVHVAYYGLLGAERQHPLHSIMVFDLGGITHFTKENQFPVEWTPAELALLTTRCYDATAWDAYWTVEPCAFVMRRLEPETKIFGTPTLTRAWVAAVIRHPVAYAWHRGAYFWTFLAGNNLTIWTKDINNPDKAVFADRPAFVVLLRIHDALKPTPLFRAGAWLLLDLALCAVAWRRRDTPAGTFGLGVCGSAAVYVLTFAAVGVASDFRYALWAVFAGIAGGATLAIAQPPCRAPLPACHR